MVGHQAETEDLQLRPGAMLGEQVQVGLAVLVIEEDVAVKVAALGDMVRTARGHHTP